MGASGTPIFKTAAANATGVTVDLGQQVAGVALRNDGPDTVFWAVGDTPPTPTKGNGRCSLDVNKSISLAGLSISELSFICATAETATVQIAAVPQGEAVLEEVAAAAGAGGFYHVQALSGGASATSGAIAIPVNGATKVICNPASMRLVDTLVFPAVGAVDGTMVVYGTFDNGIGEKVLATMVVDETFHCSGHDVIVTNTASVVDITGATLLTNIRAVVTPGANTAPTISGNVTLMGAAI